MSKRTILAGLGPALGLILVLGGCGTRGPSVAYAGPGWYLERPRFLVVTGPEIFAGPFTYDACETERTKFPDETARRLICILEKTKPGPLGPFDKVQASSAPPS